MRKAHLMLVGLLLSFAANATNDIPRPEYPRPQFERTTWVNLNGTWTYEFDLDDSGKKRNLPTAKELSKTITVPFCPESKLSGVNHTDFIKKMWYQRSLPIPADWSNKKILLHFGAVDYLAEIYIDGRLVGFHNGGSSPFVIDISRIAKPGNSHNLVVSVSDDAKSGRQTCGKQSPEKNSFACFYTRVTGIWQTVWMEALSPCGLKSANTYPDIDNNQLIITPEFYQISNDQTLEVTIYDSQKKVAQVTSKCANGSNLILPIKNIKLWSPETPHLYDISYCVKDAKGQIIDYDYQVYESPVEDDPAVPGKESEPSDPSASKSPKSRMKPCSSPFLDFPNLAEPNLEKATQQNTNKQNTKRQSTNLSGPTGESADFDQMEAQVREEFRERLEIDTLAQRYDPDKLEELLDNIVEMYCCPRQTQYVGKQPQTTKAIRLRLDKLTSQHVEYIFDVMSNTTQPIKNIMAYLRTTILNAPNTMEHYYQAQGNWLTAQSRKK